MVVLLQDKLLPDACHQYSVCLCRKGKRRTLASKAEEKDSLGGGGNKKRKNKKGRRKALLSLSSRGTEEDTPIGNVIL